MTHCIWRKYEWTDSNLPYTSTSLSQDVTLIRFLFCLSSNSILLYGSFVPFVVSRTRRNSTNFRHKIIRSFRVSMSVTKDKFNVDISLPIWTHLIKFSSYTESTKFMLMLMLQQLVRMRHLPRIVAKPKHETDVLLDCK